MSIEQCFTRFAARRGPLQLPSSGFFFLGLYRSVRSQKVVSSFSLSKVTPGKGFSECGCTMITSFLARVRPTNCEFRRYLFGDPVEVSGAERRMGDEVS